MTLNNFIIDANITWDRVSKSIFEKPQAKPGRKLRVQVTNAGVVDNLTGYTLHLGWRNSVNGIEGLDIFTAVDATKGLFELQYTEGMLSNAGSLRASLVLVNIADVTIAESNDFVIRVTPSPFSQDASQSTTSLTSLAEILLNEASREQAAAEQAAAFETYDQRIEQLETGVKHEVTNIITTNSDFATTDGFALFGASVATANNVMTITGTGSSSLPNAGFNLPNIPTGAKVYMRVWARVLNAVCSKISIRSESTEIASKVNPIENQWYEIAAIRTKTGALETALNMAMTHTYADSATANGKQMEVKWAVAIQLTEDFGAGMEPTADYTTFMLNIYDNKYFSGTATVYPVQSVAENLASVEQRIDDRFDEFVESNIVPETVTQKMLDFESASGGRLLSTERQLAEVENQFKLGVYNLKHLKKIKGKRKFTINVLSDSIGAGTAAGSNFGFMQQLENAMNVVQQKINYKYNSFYYFNNGWTATETGINKHLLSSLDTSSALQITTVTAEIPTISYKVEIIYSTRSDGGNFEVRESVTNTLLATVNCNGVSADGLKTAELTVSASNSVKIVPLTGNKAYVNGWIMKRYPSEASYKIHQLAQGGRKSKDFSDTDLINSVKFETPDLLIWELVANDFSGGDLVSYKQKTELAITTAHSIGADVLITATCGNSVSETTGYRADWVEWLKATADSFGCAFIDYDEIFGGYTSAQANGLLADTIHPTDLGHLLMANELIDVVLNIENPYNRNVIIDLSDNRKPFNNYLLEPKNIHSVGDNYFEKAYFKTTDNNGNAVFANVSPARFLTNASQLPKYAPKGAIANVNDLLYINWVDWGVSQNTQATWGAAYAIGLMETLITTPAANDKNLGKLFRLELSGKDDQIVTYIKTAAGGRKWVKLTPTDTIEWS